MKAIPTTNEKTYSGQFENWTEEIQSTFILKEEREYIHKSYEKIKSFQVGVETCVFGKNYSKELECSPLQSDINYKIVKEDDLIEYVYKMIVPAGTKINNYGNENRFYMNHNIKCFLIGTMKTIRIIDNSYETSVYGGHNINVFVEKY